MEAQRDKLREEEKRRHKRRRRREQRGFFGGFLNKLNQRQTEGKDRRGWRHEEE